MSSKRSDEIKFAVLFKTYKAIGRANEEGEGESETGLQHASRGVCCREL